MRRERRYTDASRRVGLIQAFPRWPGGAGLRSVAGLRPSPRRKSSPQGDAQARRRSAGPALDVGGEPAARPPARGRGAGAGRWPGRSRESRTGRGARSGVDEEGQLVALEIEGVFDLQLEVAHQWTPGRACCRARPSAEARRRRRPARGCPPRRPPPTCFSLHWWHIHQAAVGADEFDRQRHLAEGMGGAGQAGVEGADRHLDVVEQALGELATVEVAAGQRAWPRSWPGCCGGGETMRVAVAQGRRRPTSVVVDQVPRGLR